MTATFMRLLLPLSTEIDQARVLLPATVLASWFDTPVQIVCASQAEVAGYQVLTGSIGVPVEPVLHLEEPFAEGLAAHAHAHSPSLIIAEPNPLGMELAADSSQPVLLVAAGLGRRMPVGPFAVEVTGAAADPEAIAQAALLARSLEESVRLVHRADGADQAVLTERAAEAEARLRQMDCEVGIDAIGGAEDEPLVVVGRTRAVTAVVIPAERLGETDLIYPALANGINVLVAPGARPEAGRPAPFDADLTVPVPAAPSGASLETLDREECIARLERHSVARIGYVEDGWPTVVPVNYRVHDGDVYIRSLGGGKLRSAERGDTVCLELDGYDERLRTGWSVVAHGTLEVIRDASILSDAWANDPGPWVNADSWQWLRMTPFSIGGREVWPAAT